MLAEWTTKQFWYCYAADFFLERGEQEKGVQLLIQACQPSRALDLCQQHNITITEVSFLLWRPAFTYRSLETVLAACNSLCLVLDESKLCAEKARDGTAC